MKGTDTAEPWAEEGKEIVSNLHSLILLEK